MSFDLIVLGLFQGLSWSSLLPWDASLDVSFPFWAVRLVAGLSMFLGLLVFAFNIAMTVAAARVARRQLASCPAKGEDPIMLETKTGVFFIAGLGFFAVAFLSNAVLPIMMYRHLPEQSVEQMLEHNGNLRYQFEDLARRFPDSFTAAYGRPPQEAAAREKWLNDSCVEGPQVRAQDLRRRRLLALPQPVCSPGFKRRAALGAGVEDRGIPERAAAARDVRNQAGRPRLEPRGRPALERLARRAFLSADRAFGAIADARVSVAFRRITGQAERARAGAHHLRSMAGLVARELSLLRRLPAVGRHQPGS